MKSGNKVAILTTHRANNFGAMLQAYSLVMACRDLGAEAEILDWRNPFFEKVYHKAWRMHRNPLPAIKHLLWFLKDERISRKMFAEFRNRIPKSEAINDRTSLIDVASSYDTFIVGSDQVWNPTILATNPKHFDRTYLLDFVKDKKKYAYAASLGDRVSFTDGMLQEYVNAWQSFDGITMREKDGSDFVARFIGRSVETVVDPVLLHDIEYWRSVATKGCVHKKKFALIYNLRRSRQLSDVAQDVARSGGLEVVNLLVPAQGVLKSDNTENAGPAEMLEYIDSADCVFTGSFHAAAFSIIYGKKLYVQFIKKGGNSNTRMENLFSMCGLDGVDFFNDSNTVVRFYDCSSKNSAKMSAAIDTSKAILSQMVSGGFCDKAI